MADLVIQLQEGRAPRTAAIRERMLAPLPDEVIQELGGIIRVGSGSIADQYARQAEMRKAASFPWKRTQDFGNRRAPARTLHRSGALEDAWTGRGPGGFVRRRGARGVEVGVDSARFPQARMFQRGGITMIRVTPRMRALVGMEFGVWMRRDTARVKVEGRPVAMNREILRRARRPVVSYFNHGLSGARQRRAA